MVKTQRNFLIAAIVGLLILFLLPPVNGLTPVGVKFLAVFIPTVIIWLIEGGSGWSGLMATALIVFLGVYNGAETYKLLWGGALVALCIPFYMIANALEESGAVMWVVRWILSRKIVHGRPTLFTILFTLSLILISVMITPMVTVVIFFKVLKDLCESIGYDRDSQFYRAHGLIIGWIGQAVDGCLIWGRPFILSMVAMIVGLGFEKFTVNDFFRLAILYLIIITVVAILFVKFWIRPDCSNFENYDDAAVREELKANPLNTHSKILLVGMLAVVFCYVGAFFTPLGVVQQYLNTLPAAAPVSLAVAILALIYIADGKDGAKKPVLDIGREMSRLPWNTIIFLGSVMYFGGIVGSEEFGISACLSNIITPIVSSLSPTVSFIVGLAIASVLTNLTSNAVSCMVVLSCFVPAMIAAPNIGQAQVLAFCVCTVTVCATAIATRAACATMSLVYCPDGIDYKGTALYSIALCAVMVVVSALVLVPLGSGIFAGIV
jgi:sodium-dependent dicarboxylate transporter 2/3/5